MKTTTPTSADSLEGILAQAAPFSPLAYLHSKMDCIRILFRNCSVVEYRMDEMFTFLHAAHQTNRDGSPVVVGMVLKGMGYLCKQWNYPPDTVVQIAELLDRIIKEVAMTEPVRRQLKVVQHGAALTGLRARVSPTPDEMALAA